MNRGFRARIGMFAVFTAGMELLASLTAGSVLAAPEPAKAAVATGTGFDISYPQCANAFPKNPAFAIVGVNGGLAYSGNPCLPSEYTWAMNSTSSSQAHVSFYLNTGNPGPLASSHWPAAGTEMPQSCDGSWSQSCAYDYGWFAAQDSFNRAADAAGSAAAVAAPWWLDVETANSWSPDTATNRADLQGAVAALKAAGVNSVGLYSTASMWAQITGAATSGSALNDPFRTLTNWVPGARSAKDAPNFCSRSFAGGRVKLVQYPANNFDGDYACF